MAATESIKHFDWKFVIQAWVERANRGGISIHAIATTCKRPPEIILQEMEQDVTPGLSPYLCGGKPPTTWDLYEGNGMGLPAFGYDPYHKNSDTETMRFAKLSLERYPWPDFGGFQKWKGQKKVSFKGYYNSTLTIEKLRDYAEACAADAGYIIVWGEGLHKLKSQEK